MFYSILCSCSSARLNFVLTKNIYSAAKSSLLQELCWLFHSTHPFPLKLPFNRNAFLIYWKPFNIIVLSFIHDCTLTFPPSQESNLNQAPPYQTLILPDCRIMQLSQSHIPHLKQTLKSFFLYLQFRLHTLLLVFNIIMFIATHVFISPFVD